MALQWGGAVFAELVDAVERYGALGHPVCSTDAVATFAAPGGPSVWVAVGDGGVRLEVGAAARATDPALPACEVRAPASAIAAFLCGRGLLAPMVRRGEATGSFVALAGITGVFEGAAWRAIAAPLDPVLLAQALAAPEAGAVSS